MKLHSSYVGLAHLCSKYLDRYYFTYSLSNMPFIKPVMMNQLRTLCNSPVCFASYVQGQEPEPKIREYFYFIDHQGMLFLDDSRMKNFTSCFKEKKFLDFFFKRIRINSTGRYKEFPFISLCGKERNFIRCDDVPIVYTHILADPVSGNDILTYGYAGDALKTNFLPEKIFMRPHTGRVYHPAEDKYGGIGLIRSKLAIELSKYFEFKNGDLHPPTHFTWKNITYDLDQFWFEEKLKKYDLKIKSVPD